MLDKIFSTVLTSGITPAAFMICSAVSLALGFIISLSHMYRNTATKSFALTLTMLPLIVQVIIMLVNGNLGTGIAVAGTFSLVRFRSVPGSAKEILSIFMAMAAGLACGIGYIGIAIIFVLLLTVINILYTISTFGEFSRSERDLKITIPENLNYSDVFDDLFKEYTVYHNLKRVKTSNMGSLYQLYYKVKLKNPDNEKEFIDKIRCRNGNLDIISNYCATASEEL